MIEVRNDLLRTAADVAAWTERLTQVLQGSGEAIGIDAAQVAV
jgi:predicted N-formylglutamate amidohydrolase